MELSYLFILCHSAQFPDDEDDDDAPGPRTRGGVTSANQAGDGDVGDEGDPDALIQMMARQREAAMAAMREADRMREGESRSVQGRVVGTYSRMREGKGDMVEKGWGQATYCRTKESRSGREDMTFLSVQAESSSTWWALLYALDVDEL